MLGKDGRFYDADFDFDGDGKYFIFIERLFYLF